MDLTYRPRRLRRTSALRSMVREHSLSARDFIYPLFVHEGDEIEEATIETKVADKFKQKFNQIHT